MGKPGLVVALAALTTALFLRRPEEPATTPLLICAASLLGSTLAFVAGLPALALATGGPVLWLYNLCVIGVYSLAWGGGSPSRCSYRETIVDSGPGEPCSPWPMRLPVLMLAWMCVAALFAPNGLRWFDLVYAGTTVLVVATLVTVGVLGVVTYRRSRDPLIRSRLRWIAGGSIVAAVLGLAGWHLPELITGSQLLPSGAIGLSGLPFVVGLAVALRRHRLFDIERLANRSSGVYRPGRHPRRRVRDPGRGAGQRLRLSGTVAAAIAAAAAALALAPLRNAAQRTVNRLMYGGDDPAECWPSRDPDAGGRCRTMCCPWWLKPLLSRCACRTSRSTLPDGTSGTAWPPNRVCRWAPCTPRPSRTTVPQSVGCGCPSVAATTRSNPPIWSLFARSPARWVLRSRPYVCTRICCGHARRSSRCGKDERRRDAISTMGWDRRWRRYGSRLAARQYRRNRRLVDCSARSTPR